MRSTSSTARDILDGRSPAPITEPQHAALGPATLSRAVGRYRVARVGVVTVRVRDRRAYIRIDRGIEYPAFPVGDGELYVPGLDAWIGFALEPAAADSPFRRLRWLSIFEVAEGPRER